MCLRWYSWIWASSKAWNLSRSSSNSYVSRLITYEPAHVTVMSHNIKHNSINTTFGVVSKTMTNVTFIFLSQLKNWPGKTIFLVNFPKNKTALCLHVSNLPYINIAICIINFIKSVKTRTFLRTRCCMKLTFFSVSITWITSPEIILLIRAKNTHALWYIIIILSYLVWSKKGKVHPHFLKIEECICDKVPLEYHISTFIFVCTLGWNWVIAIICTHSWYPKQRVTSQIRPKESWIRNYHKRVTRSWRIAWW